MVTLHVTDSVSMVMRLPGIDYIQAATDEEEAPDSYSRRLCFLP